MADELRLRVLGGGQINRDGQPVTGFLSSKVTGLLYYLAVTGRPHTRHHLAGLLWDTMPDVDARKNLRMALYQRMLANPTPTPPRR